MNNHSRKTKHVKVYSRGALLILGVVLLLSTAVLGADDPVVTVGFEGSKTINAGMPVPIRVFVKSSIPLTEPKLTLKVPAIASNPEKEVVLWTGSPDIRFKHEFNYPASILPAGKYQFQAVLEFTASNKVQIPLIDGKRSIIADNPEKGEKRYRLLSSVCFDVRADRVSVGPTFEVIEKRELIREISLKDDSQKGKNLWLLSIADLVKINSGLGKDKAQ